MISKSISMNSQTLGVAGFRKSHTIKMITYIDFYHINKQFVYKYALKKYNGKTE